MHLRLPAFDRGVTSFLWAFGLSLYLLLFLWATALTNRPTAFILSLLAFCAIFLFVRIYGEDVPRQPAKSRESSR